MNTHFFSYVQTGGVATATLLELALSKSLETERVRLRGALQQNANYHTPYASLLLPFDQCLIDHVRAVVEEKLAFTPTVLLVVGIGGSSLGAQAVLQALQKRTEKSGRLCVYFVETVDADYMQRILGVCRQELEAGKQVLVNVVTKSGTTTETVINFYVILELLKQYRPDDYQTCVVVTTDAQSQLWHLAQKENFTTLEIPALVGGRFSVFSAAGLFPLALAGVDIEELCVGACQMITSSLKSDMADDPACMSACLQYYQYQQGRAMSDLFLFSVDLEGVGKWYRQLLAESIGKERFKKGEKVSVGITPLVSVGTVDLHSMVQLYLAGPHDKFTTFVAAQETASSVTIPAASTLYPGKTYANVMSGLLKGTQAAYLQGGRPFCTVLLDQKNEWSLGRFLQFKMLETIYLGFLFSINPFDQPQVELYKKEAQKILSE